MGSRTVPASRSRAVSRRLRPILPEEIAMHYQAHQEGPITVVTIQGNMTGGPVADEFRLFISGLIEERKRLFVFDLSEVNYVASPGAGMILGAHTSLSKRDGVLKVVVKAQRVKNLLNLIQLYRILEIHESMEEALASFAQDQRVKREAGKSVPDAPSATSASA